MGKTKAEAEAEKDGWEQYDKTFAPYPDEGDEDLFYRGKKPRKDENSKMNKLLVETNDRTISVFESQIRPVAHYFGEHPTAQTVRVLWIKDGNRILPEVQDTLEG
jgi:hypothetical protein